MSIGQGLNNRAFKSPQASIVSCISTLYAQPHANISVSPLSAQIKDFLILSLCKLIHHITISNC